jgi:thioesterase domain-containing protein
VISLRDLALSIGDERPIYGLQPSELDLRVLSLPSLEELATELIKNMKRVMKSGPYHLLGFSGGGCIAYEIARQLRDSGEPVGLLGLLDTYVPGYPRPLPLPKRVIQQYRLIRQLGPRERFQYVIDRSQSFLRKVRGRLSTPRPRIRGDRVGRSSSDPIVTYTWNDVHHHYRPRAYDGRLDLFITYKPDWREFTNDDPTLGWEKLVGGGLRLHRIIGGHHDIIRPPWANDLAAEIRRCLDQAGDLPAAQPVRGT